MTPRSIAAKGAAYLLSGHNGNASHVLRALHDRNYRIFFAGQGLAATGVWIQNIAMSWLIYRLTDSAWMLGLTAFASQIPNFLLAPAAGVWIDRWPKNKVLIATQTLSFIQSLLLVWLTLSGRIEMWQVLCLSFFTGCVNAFDVPAKHAATAEMMANPDDKQNAIAINSITYNTARMLGPSLAGILIPLIGEGLCFLLNSVSYFIAVVSLLLLRIRQESVKQCQENVFQRFQEGFTYTFGQKPLRSILLLLGIVSLTAAPYTVLLPVFVTKYISGGAGTLGYLMAVAGLGSLFGAAWLATRPTFFGFDKLVAAAAALIGTSLVAFMAARNLWLCTLLMFCLGLGFVIQIVASNTLLQSMVDNSLRGRIMSFYTMILIGIGPIGSLLAGALVSRFGVISTFVAGGICCIAGAVLFYRNIPAFRKQACPIYVKAGTLSSYDQCRF